MKKGFDTLFCEKIKEKSQITDSWDGNSYKPKKEFGSKFLKNKLKEIQNEKSRVN
jgi:hypothetical protein